MRRILLIFAAALALTALPGWLAAGAARGNPGDAAAMSAAAPFAALVSVPAPGAPSDAEAGEDGDDSPVALAASATIGVPDSASIGGPCAHAPSMVARDSVSRPLCRGRPPRAPRAMTPSRVADSSARLLPEQFSRLLPAEPDPRRLSPHLRP